MDKIVSDELEKVLNEIGKDLVKELSLQLMRADKRASGNLIDSLDYKVVEAVDGFFLEIIAADYLKYVDQGRRPGKQPPTKAIRKWIDDRKILPRDKKTGRFIKKESAAFLMARSIGKKGIKPTNVIKKSVDNIFKSKQQLLAKAAIGDIEALINKILS